MCALMVVHVIMHLSKPIECSAPRAWGEHGVSAWIDQFVTNVAVGNEGGCARVGAWVHGNSLYLLLNSAANLKLL